MKINYKKKYLFNFAILKFHNKSGFNITWFSNKKKQNKIDNFINDFVNKYQLEVELSKDISIKKINKITLNITKFLIIDKRFL